MTRVLKLGYLSVAALLIATFVFGQGKPKEAEKPEVKKNEPPLYVRLQKIFNAKGFDDPKLTLADVVDTFITDFDIPVEINRRAFNAESVMSVDKTPIADPNPIPPMKNVRVEALLRKVLERIPSPSGATFTIRRDHVEITTNKAQQEEFWPNAPEETEPVFPLVHANFEKKPLDEALKELAERTDVTIILDSKATEKEKPAVTVRLTNTPLETAVRLLAEMNDLRSVIIGKTLFVTSAEKAKRLQEQMYPAQPPLGGIGPMPGAGALGVLGAIGQAGIGALGAIGQAGMGGIGQIGFGGIGGGVDPIGGSPKPYLPGSFRPRNNGAAPGM